MEFAQLSGKEIIWDLYCGIGTISLFLARHAKKVYGVEINSQAIDDARENAVNNQIPNADFFVGKAEEILPKFYQEKGIVADLIVVDPPRKGCDEACLDTMVQMKPKKIIYVSCDSATLARDLKILMAGGYEVKRVQAVDLFPHTVHCETVVLMERTALSR
jgi:23S rRNA (uracil1939-C5)-methyltransferase